MARRAGFRWGWGLLISACLSAALILGLLTTTSGTAGTRPWAWLLTGAQVVSMWMAGSGRRNAWLVGAAVQPAWIAYALVTNQEGFIIGCIVSAGVQFSNFLRPTNGPRPSKPKRSDESSSILGEMEASPS